MKTLFLLISLTFSAISPAFAAIAPLSTEQAFQFSGTAKDYQTVLLTWKIAPAIACGNVCICKPSEVTSLTAYMLCDVIVKSGLPKGVVNMVFGDGPKAGQPI